MKTKEIATNSIVATLYIVLTIVATPLSYGAIQFRISEILVLLCFFNYKYIFGLTIGCFIANLNSPTMSLDLLFGTSATVLACLGIIACKYLWMAIFPPIIFNGFIVAWELTFFDSPFWFSVGTIMLGEAVVLILVISYFSI